MEKRWLKLNNDQFQILVQAILDEKLSTGKINEQLKQLKIDSVKLTASFDSSTLSKSIGEVAAKIKQANQSTQLRVFDRDKLEKEGVDFIFKSENIINRVKKKFSDLGTVNISNVFDDHGKISGFVAEVTKANNTIEKYQYNLAKIKTGNSTQQGFIYSGGLGIDKNAGAELEKTLDFLSRIDTRIKDIYSKATTQTKPLLGDSKEYDVFNNKLEETKSEIDRFRESNETLSKDHKRQIGEMVADLDRYRKEQQNLAYAVKELKPDTFPVAKTQELKELDTLITKWESSGLFTGEFRKDVLEAKSALEGATNPQDLDGYNAKINILKEDFKQLSISAKSFQQSFNLDENKKKILTDIDTQINKIADNPHLSKFVEELNSIKSRIQEANAAELGGLRKEFQTTNSSIRQVNDEVKRINDGIKLNLEKVRFSNSVEKWAQDNSKSLKALGLDIDNILAQVQSADRIKMDALKTEFEDVKSRAREAGLEGKTFGDTIKESFSRLTAYFSIAAMFGMATNEVRKMISTVQELNKVAVDLQIASGYTKEQVAGLMDTYNQLGQRIGATTVEVAQSADSFLRQGHSIEQTNKLIEASMMLSKLGQIDSAEATQYLTSAMKGYKVSVEDVTGIVDKLAAVDMEAAVSAGGIAEGMSEVANSANIAGISIDKLIGYLTTVGEVTQSSMNQVGNVFNRIFSRMGNIKLGRLDDYENSGESLNNVETVLEGLDIKLRDSVGEFRNFGDVLDEVAGKWESYGSVEKNAIAVAFAGVHAREEFLVLMQNYDKALEYTQTSMESFGTATEKMKVYEDGLEASTKRATAAFEALSSTVINSDFLKGAVDTGIGLLGAVNWLLKNLGTIPVLIGGITAAMSLKNSNAGKINSKLLAYREVLVA